MDGRRYRPPRGMGSDGFEMVQTVRESVFSGSGRSGAGTPLDYSGHSRCLFFGFGYPCLGGFRA
jgi:hypothetical protein